MGSLGSENEVQVRIDVESISGGGSGGGSYMHKYRLYETRSNFYMIGWNKNRTCWKVLKINRLEQVEFSIIEDPASYSEIECCDLLNRIHEGNKSTGGLKFVTTCYGIVGLIKFLGPYYMLLITKRRKIGTICGHAVYAIAKSEMIPIPNSTVQSNMAISKNENRYKKLLHTMDLTKGFFFSYSYHAMLSLQKNLRNHETRSNLYDTLFVWNEFLTRGICNQLKNSVWTVALVYGFFRQVKISISGRDFNLILIARRSRHYAGTRYLKRGVNKKGRVANDVETEQIVFEDVPEGCPLQISSVVQIRGSIPLFWSQEISRLSIKPDIILSKEDHKYEATKLHFENLVKRYENPIIVLDLVKRREKKPRESILRTEFAKALELINEDLAHGNRLKFLHWDMSKHSRNNAASALAYLVKVATNSLDLTGFFYCQLLPSSSQVQCSNNYGDCADVDVHNMTNVDESHFVKPALFQKGVLRTNCIDCLDRTNIAQFAYGLVALGHQLRALGYVDVSTINLDSQLAGDLMNIYEAMGDTLALQYGGSAAHHKIFSELRGQWKAATQSQEFLKSLHRFYNNAYMDAEKQDAINVFLGHFQPQQGKPALWELDSDQHYHVGRRDSDFSEENSRLYIKRSLSVGDINFDSDSAIDDANVLQIDNICKPLPVNIPGYNAILTESMPETCDCVVSSFRYTPSTSRTQLLPETEPAQYLDNGKLRVVEHGDSFNYSNFLGTDRLSSSGNSWEEDKYERSSLIPSAPSGSSSGEMKEEAGLANESGSSLKVKEPTGKDLCCGSPCCCENPNGFSKQFVHWVAYDDLFSLDVNEIRAS